MRIKFLIVTDPQGNSYSLSQMLDKPVVLNFWASWCPPCKSEMPDFEKLYAIYGERVNFVMVSVDDTLEEAKDFYQGSGYTFPAYFDSEGSGSYIYIWKRSFGEFLTVVCNIKAG